MFARAHMSFLATLQLNPMWLLHLVLTVFRQCPMTCLPWNTIFSCHCKWALGSIWSCWLHPPFETAPPCPLWLTNALFFLFFSVCLPLAPFISFLAHPSWLSHLNIGNSSRQSTRPSFSHSIISTEVTSSTPTTLINTQMQLPQRFLSLIQFSY